MKEMNDSGRLYTWQVFIFSSILYFIFIFIIQLLYCTAGKNCQISALHQSEKQFT